MIIEFEDECWRNTDQDWNRNLVELLALIANREQHAIQADADLMIPWCDVALKLHVEYFKVRLANAQARANAVKIVISPLGLQHIATDPPWKLTAAAAYELINRPLRVFLENDKSDRLFLDSTTQKFSDWCSKGWIEPVMGGGSAMSKDIASAGADHQARWRTFFMFDSDRLHPSELSDTWTPPNGDGCQGYVFERACATMPPQRWHRLVRRSIENYLPTSMIASVDADAAVALQDESVGEMAHFYNFKKGLQGDGLIPDSGANELRAARSQGFWLALPPENIARLKHGFGRSISDEFQKLISADLQLGAVTLRSA